jgi:hypothetical protein
MGGQVVLASALPLAVVSMACFGIRAGAVGIASVVKDVTNVYLRALPSQSATILGAIYIRKGEKMPVSETSGSW